ncbi:glycerophosphodiester phosphodiesterase [Roseateles terrae]|uniref:Glycerophosphoryl diester phosphodiesterase n=1 Tax=Roseateles terrae TaxID=431060 RepID=A0ABR6GSM0_9BURK|nr:glycerophosphodiester phosphodiesterase [Roseateles terrae]MBB3195101.1 glycerophosphoryl diester phosphodiesterase [Roseateles terrae]OWQ87129.1 glycerophosphodiester phosphodiesterase [Roseateles terrae]
MDAHPWPWSLPFWIAHRGAGKLAPENTLAAFREGARHGYRAFECDVKLAADGVPFLLHDATLDRTTSARGRASDRPWAELSRLDAGRWHSRAYAGEPPASLEAIAAFVRVNQHALNIEIKPTPGDERRTGQVVGQEVLRLWKDAATVSLLFSSFEPEALRGAQETAPQVPRALLLDKLTPDWLATAQGLDCRAVVTHYALMDQALVAQLHKLGMKALVYTVNDAATAQWLIGNGVDGIITDAVDRFSPIA